MKENRFALFLTSILLILTIILTFNLYKDYNKTKKEETEKTVFEKKINKNNISKLVIYNPNKIELTKKGNFWYVYPINDLAYSYMVENILSNIYQPSVSDVIKSSDPNFNSYFKEFFKTYVDVYFLYSNNYYHLKKGVKNNATNETYLWIDLPDFKNKIYVVNYWDLNYLDNNADSFRMKKLLNIDQDKVDKIIVNDKIIYKEEIVFKSKKKKKDDEEKDNKKEIWKLSDGQKVSKEYINSLFAVLNNYDFKYALDDSSVNLNLSKPFVHIEVFSGKDVFKIDFYRYKKEEYLVKCSYREPLLVFNSFEVDQWLKNQLIEKKIFSYYIDNFDEFDKILISDSNIKVYFDKKEGKWISFKKEEKTAQINLFFNALKNLEYKQRFLTKVSNDYQLYEVELISKKEDKKYRFYLYNPDYLSFGKEIYKIDPFVFILKDLFK